MGDRSWVGAPYARLYSTLREDHPAVWNSDANLAWYVRLLVQAERAYPVALEWPRRLPSEVQDALVTDGAVDAIGVDCFTIHGLDRLHLARVEAQNLGARQGGLTRAAQAVRGPDGTFLPAGVQPPGSSRLDDAGLLNGETPVDLDQAPGPEPGSRPGQVQPTPGVQPKLPSRPLPSRAAPSGPGTGESRAPAPAPAPAPEAPTATATAPDPRTVAGHPRYVALAEEEADWVAWAASQPEPSTYPDARPSNQGRFGEAHPDCRSPETLEHRRYWRWIGRDRGWVCLYCDRADTRTFRDRMDQASESPF
jgi:hypothetical protein